MSTNLQKADEVGENEPIDGGKTLDDFDRHFRVVVAVNAALVEREGYKGFTELSVPQLEKRCRHVRVTEIARGGGQPAVATNLERVHLVYVTWYSGELRVVKMEVSL